MLLELATSVRYPRVNRNLRTQTAVSQELQLVSPHHSHFYDRRAMQDAFSEENK